MTFDRDAFHRDAIQIPSHEDVTVMRELLDDTLTDQGHPTTIDDAGNLLISRDCHDETGCPSCLMSSQCGNQNAPLHKSATTLILSELLDRTTE